MTDSAAGLAPGSVFGGYRIESFVARGGMGMVYRATQLALERTVALKLVAPELAGDESFRERFKREALLAAALDHPNILPVYEAGEIDSQLFLAMRYVLGDDLDAIIAREGKLSPARAAAIAVQVAGALDAAHDRGLVHRDVKPGNILIAQEYGEERAYLTDFGLTKRSATEARLTRTGFMVGTLDYVAPEQAKGEAVDGRADTYALACVLFVAITGKVPFDRDSDVAKLFAHLNDPPPSATEVCPEVPQELDEVIRRGMAKLPQDRHDSAGEFARAARGAATVAAPAGPSRTEIKPAALSRTEVTRERAAGAPRGGLAPRHEGVPGRGTRLAATVKAHRVAAAGIGVVVVAVAVAIALIAGGGGSHPATTQASSTVPPASVTASGQAATTVAAPSSQAAIYNAQVASIIPRLRVIFDHFPIANDFGKRSFSQASLAVAGQLRGVADNLDALSPPPPVLTDHEALVTHLREMEQAWRSLATDSDNRDFSGAHNDLQKVKTTLAQIHASVRRVESTR